MDNINVVRKSYADSCLFIICTGIPGKSAVTGSLEENSQAIAPYRVVFHQGTLRSKGMDTPAVLMDLISLNDSTRAIEEIDSPQGVLGGLLPHERGIIPLHLDPGPMTASSSRDRQVLHRYVLCFNQYCDSFPSATVHDRVPGPVPDDRDRGVHRDVLVVVPCVDTDGISIS